MDVEIRIFTGEDGWMLKYDHVSYFFWGGGVEKHICDDREVMGYPSGCFIPFFVRLFVASVIVSMFLLLHFDLIHASIWQPLNLKGPKFQKSNPFWMNIKPNNSKIPSTSMHQNVTCWSSQCSGDSSSGFVHVWIEYTLSTVMWYIFFPTQFSLNHRHLQVLFAQIYRRNWGRGLGNIYQPVEN